jgi:glutathione S-transferase-like protein
MGHGEVGEGLQDACEFSDRLVGPDKRPRDAQGLPGAAGERPDEIEHARLGAVGLVDHARSMSGIGSFERRAASTKSCRQDGQGGGSSFDLDRLLSIETGFCRLKWTPLHWKGRPLDATLTISSKNYSSWSLRGWLLVKFSGLPFAEEIVPSDDPSVRAELLLLSPSFLVPCLRHHGIIV